MTLFDLMYVTFIWTYIFKLFKLVLYTYMCVLYSPSKPIDVYFFSIRARRGTLVVGDSRCCYLRDIFEGSDIRCYAYRGAGIMTVCDRAKGLIRRYNPVSCLLLCGINDVTFMNKTTRVIRPRLSDSFDLANHIIMLILQERRNLINLYPATKIIFGGIIGVSLNTYNRLPDISPYQYTIDDTIMQVNSYLRLLNQLTLASQPRLTSKVHCWRKGVRKNYYHLLHDGLHLGPLLRDVWVREINGFHNRNSALASQCLPNQSGATVREPS